MKHPSTSKTIVFNVLTFASLGLAAMADKVPPEWVIYIALATNLVNIGLRFVTKTPISLK